MARYQCRCGYDTFIEAKFDELQAEQEEEKFPY